MTHRPPESSGDSEYQGKLLQIPTRLFTDTNRDAESASPAALYRRSKRVPGRMISAKIWLRTIDHENEMLCHGRFLAFSLEWRAG
jgi:hypothetical protein